MAPDAICALAALFIVGMVWLRTRLHYRSRGRAAPPGGLRALSFAGRGYFAALLALIALGWFLAPALAARLAPGTPVAPVLARVVWFLTVYYLFIPVHRLMQARGVEVFKSPVAGIQD
jgi:sterol desaturase/sphingolipid hydroxylase (fatty acid hydroxylase superfamily)